MPLRLSHSPMLRELCCEPIRMEDGFIRVPQGPGLGGEVNEEVVKRFRIG